MPMGPIESMLPRTVPAEKMRGGGHFTARAAPLDHIPTPEYPQPASARANLFPTPHATPTPTVRYKEFTGTAIMKIDKGFGDDLRRLFDLTIHKALRSSSAPAVASTRCQSPTSRRWSSSSSPLVPVSRARQCASGSSHGRGNQAYVDSSFMWGLGAGPQEPAAGEKMAPQAKILGPFLAKTQRFKCEIIHWLVQLYQ